MEVIDCVLLVDDDEVSTLLHERLFRELGLAREIVSKSNGQEAFNFIKGNYNSNSPLPSLVLADLSMPVMDGFEFIQRYKTMNFKFKNKPVIIFLTTSKNAIDLQRASENNIVDYINKPLTSDKVKELLSKHFQ